MTATQILWLVFFLVLTAAGVILTTMIGVVRLHTWWVWLRGRDYKRPLFRPGRVYLITGYRPFGRRSLILRRAVAWLYVGQTRHRDFMTRVNQHRYGYMSTPPAWWAGDYVSARCVYSSQRVTTWGLDLREWFFVKVCCPLHNYRMNRSNPRRVVPPQHVLDDLKARKTARITQQRAHPELPRRRRVAGTVTPRSRRPTGRRAQW